MCLENHLDEITDYRRPQGLRHTKSQMFSMIIISNLCGHFGGRPVARFTKYYRSTFEEALHLKFPPPSHVSFSGFINGIDEAQMIAAFNSWTAECIPLQKGTAMSGDGKALGSTVTNACNKKQDFQAIVSLFCQQSGLVYAFERYKNGKASEANVVRFLLTQLKDMGVTIFLDALHTQKKRY